MEKTNAVIDFLLGEGELEGRWFGDGIPEGKGPFWWRTHLRKYAKEQEWIKTEDRLPEFGVHVICFCAFNGRFIGSYERIDPDYTYGNWHDGNVLGVLPPTHWMPLPERPKE